MVILFCVAKHSLLPQELLLVYMTQFESLAHTGVMKPSSDLASPGVNYHSWLGSCSFPAMYRLGNAWRPAVQALNYLLE